MAVSSEDINYLVWRYLQESGFFHTAFTFQTESSVSRAKVNAADVPVGALIKYLQKGLQYKELETHISEDGRSRCDAPFSLCKPHQCKQISSSSSSSSSSGRRKNKRKNSKTSSSSTSTGILDDIEPMHDDQLMYGQDGSTGATGTQEKGGTAPNTISMDKVTILKGHKSEVFICSFNPKFSNILASGSGDSTARIWTLPEQQHTSNTRTQPSQLTNSIILEHYNNDTNQSSKDVTTIDWNFTGTMLATGSYDGIARIWDHQGRLMSTLRGHQGPIFSLKWNQQGNHLLSGSVDRTAIIWDASSGQVKQRFGFHTQPTLDVDWRNNTSFATCSTDHMIYVCELGKDSPVRCMKGHQNEVNAIKWNPSGSLLASCSDDSTAKIWSMNQEKCLHDFTSHKREIYTIKWSPAHVSPQVLASASFDTTIKLWDVEVGACVLTLSKHVEPVYSVAFSPNGEYLASGSFDRCLHVWSTKDGSLVKTYRGDGGIFEVCWNNRGDQVAASYSNHTVSVIDLRQ